MFQIHSTVTGRRPSTNQLQEGTSVVYRGRQDDTIIIDSLLSEEQIEIQHRYIE